MSFEGIGSCSSDWAPWDQKTGNFKDFLRKANEENAAQYMNQYHMKQKASVIEYLERNNVFNLLKFLLYRVITETPKDVRDYLVSLLEHLSAPVTTQEVDETQKYIPSFSCYDDEELWFLFRMLDADETSSISSLKVKSAFSRLLGHGEAAQVFLEEEEPIPELMTVQEFIPWVKHMLGTKSAAHYELKKSIPMHNKD